MNKYDIVTVGQESKFRYEIEADRFYLQHGIAVFYYDGNIIASVPADKCTIQKI